MIAVTIEETAPDERLAVFGRAFALTGREAELLGLLAEAGDGHTVPAGHVRHRAHRAEPPEAGVREDP
ncbi:hypothetical protein [Streptomyces sp. NPDC058678]|uniref:hypothetical protein n=1 Tax=Streptomyces sp. NPDC058678 TaxID=3346595 RepID=UPI00365B3589